MGRTIFAAVAVTVGLWLLVGFAFPLVMTGVSALAFPYQAGGSLVRMSGKVVGAQNVGQNFYGARQYFWGRPSATVNPTTGKPEPYNAFASGPSNLGPTNKLLIEHIQSRVAALEKAMPGVNAGKIPLSLVESSGSGLDPEITVSSALVQVPRVAAATGLSQGYLQTLIRLATVPAEWGLFGRRGVNVLDLNLLVYQALHGK